MAREISRVKKKKWHIILAPKIFNQVVLGESLTTDPKSLIGRHIAVNLMTITNNIKQQDANIGFKIIDAKEDKLLTQTTSYTMTSAAVKRAVRRNRDKIDDSFVCITADNKKIRIKLFLLTRFNTKNSILTTIRKSARKNLIETIKKSSFESIIRDLVARRIQNQLRSKLDKIFPLKICWIRALTVEKEKNEVKEETAKKEEVKKAKEVKIEEKVEARREIKEKN